MSTLSYWHLRRTLGLSLRLPFSTWCHFSCMYRPVTDCTEILTRPAGFLAFLRALPDPLSLWKEVEL